MMNHQAFKDKIDQHIQTDGLSVLGTEDGFGRPFAYTIGLYDPEKKRKLYEDSEGFEILICGLPMRHAHIILNHIAQVKGEIDFGKDDDRFASVPMRFYKANHALKELHEKYVVQADNYHGLEVPVIQAVFPDKEGRWPGNLNYQIETPIFYRIESAV